MPQSEHPSAFIPLSRQYQRQGHRTTGQHPRRNEVPTRGRKTAPKKRKQSHNSGDSGAAGLAQHLRSTAQTLGVKDLVVLVSMVCWSCGKALTSLQDAQQDLHLMCGRMDSGEDVALIAKSRECSYEIQILQKLPQHPNIIRPLHMFEEKPLRTNSETITVTVLPWLSFALPQTSRDAVMCTADVLRALAHLHKNSIIHRDVKPANIGCRETNDQRKLWVLTDFDVAIDLREEDCTEVVGTDAFMAPEVAMLRDSGSHVAGSYSYPADMFSLGKTIHAVLDSVDAHEFCAPYDVLPERRLLMCIAAECLHQCPEERPTADAALQGIEAFLQQSARE